jgi:hypothetical protein
MESYLENISSASWVYSTPNASIYFNIIIPFMTVSTKCSLFPYIVIQWATSNMKFSDGRTDMISKLCISIMHFVHRMHKNETTEIKKKLK